MRRVETLVEKFKSQSNLYDSIDIGDYSKEERQRDSFPEIKRNPLIYHAATIQKSPVWFTCDVDDGKQIFVASGSVIPERASSYLQIRTGQQLRCVHKVESRVVVVFLYAGYGDIAINWSCDDAKVETNVVWSTSNGRHDEPCAISKLNYIWNLTKGKNAADTCLHTNRLQWS